MSAVEQHVAPISLDDLSLDSFAGRPVAVLGFARSGLALARFLTERGAQVTVYDARPAQELAEQIEALGGRQARLLLGPDVDPAQALEGQALVCTSPSVSSRYPTTEPRLRQALARLEAESRVPLVSEMDLFLRLCPAPTVGVTGTKGKTTTSALSAAILAAAGRPVVLGGNIGVPLVEQLPELTAVHTVVLEISELQLPTLSRGCETAVFTHVTSDHLDRHGSLEAYRAVKRRLAELAPADGRLVLNAEDPLSSGFAQAGVAAALFYRRAEPGPGEVGIAKGWVVARDIERLPRMGGGRTASSNRGRVLALDEIRLAGEHNLSNVLAGVAVGLLHGVEPAEIRQAVAEFAGVEHRLQTVALIDGVRFVNDSMGTQPEAVIAALRSFPRPLVLIAGGRGKGLSLETLASEVARRADAVVLIGETAQQMERLFARAGARQLERAEDLSAAVHRADQICRELLAAGNQGPATVLLSPAAASFDMFVDYADRGRVFVAAVEAIAQRRPGRPAGDHS